MPLTSTGGRFAKAPPPCTSRISWLRELASALIQTWQQRLGVKVDRFFIQRMKTKWGGSSPQRRTIRLNLELAKKDIECLDYVILHELAHFIVQNHSEGFIALLDRHIQKTP